MKAVSTAWLAVVAAMAASAAATAQTHRSALSAYVAVTSDYRAHGLSQTRGEPALQFSIDYQHASGFFGGGWASNVDYAGQYASASERSVEADYYVGYDYRHNDWSWTATLTRYGYADHAADYDYSELSSTVGFADKVFYRVAFADDLYARGDSALHQELSVVWPLPEGIDLSGTLGRFASDYVSGGAYTHWDLGVSKLLGRLSFDLRHYENNYDYSYGYLGDPTGGQWVLSASYGFLTTTR